MLRGIGLIVDYRHFGTAWGPMTVTISKPVPHNTSEESKVLILAASGWFHADEKLYENHNDSFNV